jgi:hypothetical protein
LLGKFANPGSLCHNPRARRPADYGLPWRRQVPNEHDPEKWIPVFGKDHAQLKIKARFYRYAIVTIAAAALSRRGSGEQNAQDEDQIGR